MEKATRLQLKKIRQLVCDKQFRDQENSFVAEGKKIIADVFKKGYVPRLLLVSSSFSDDPENKNLLQTAKEISVPVYSLSDREIGKVSDLKNSQGILAVLPKPSFPEQIESDNENQYLILADGIQDPGNVGAMIRTAVAFGASSMILTGDSVDVFNPKVVRAYS